MSRSADNQVSNPRLEDARGPGPEAPQVAAAMAARAKLERLLAAPSPFAGDDGAICPEVGAALEAEPGR